MKNLALRTALQTKVLHSAFYELDPVSKMDLNHAHDCANNFGKCSIKELEEMKKGERKIKNNCPNIFYFRLMFCVFLLETTIS
jgi:hypothetical protein